MTRDEFKAWFAHHKARFTGLADWIERVRKDGGRNGGDGNASVKAVFEAWATALAYVTLEASKAASDDLFNGTAEVPRSFEQHPAAVAKLARSKMHSERNYRRTIDGQATVRCQLCEDTGMVRVWQPSSLRHIKACYKDGTEPERKHLKTGAVACTCEMGDCCRWIGMRYDKAKHCRIAWMDGIPPEPIFAEQYGEALAWLHSGRAAAQANYEPNFA